jgi:hypothetical protein
MRQSLLGHMAVAILLCDTLFVPLQTTDVPEWKEKTIFFSVLSSLVFLPFLKTDCELSTCFFFFRKGTVVEIIISVVKEVSLCLCVCVCVCLCELTERINSLLGPG